MRLYAAVHPPAAALAELAAALAPVRAARPGLRWAGLTGGHLTLAFYGEVDEPAAAALGDLLAEAAAAAPPLRLRLAGAGAFPARAGAHRVLWAGIEGDADAAPLRALADRCAAAGDALGLPPPAHRAFQPHLTLARTRVPQDLGEVAALLADFAGTPWPVGSVDLMRSHFPEAGHTLLRALPLGG